MLEVLRVTTVDCKHRKIIYQLYKNQKAVIEVKEENRFADIKQRPLIFNIFIENTIRKIVQTA